MDTQSGQFDRPAVAQVPIGLPISGPPTGPLEPPRRPRPDPTTRAGAVGGYRGFVVTPPTIQAEEPASSPTPLVAPSSGWGWRSLVAFVVGGVLTGGGFAVAQLSTEAEGAQVQTAIPITTPAQPTTPSTVPPSGGGLPDNETAEPALLVAEVLGPSVVQITTTTGVGSGVIYGDGLIMTNHHVIDGATNIVVQLSDGRYFPGTVLGSDANVDVAVISVGEGLDLPIATLAVGERAKVGQTAIAIGSPFSLQQTVTEGIVSAVDRPIPSGSGSYNAMIQTDAPINPGNSGGALADRQGRVIGINTAIQTGGNSNTNAGVGFAIPINRALSVADRIVAGEPIESGQLGVGGGRSSDGSAGVEVQSVTDASAADIAGLEVGDRILSIDGAPVSSIEELAGLVVAHQPGDRVELEVVRDNERIVIEAVLDQRDP